VPGNTFELRAWETDQRCDGSTYECEVYATFNPDLPTVVEVNNAAFPRIATLGNDGGTAVIQGTWQVPGPSCGTTLPVFHSIQVQNIKVDIFLSSTKITDTTTNVIVGQQISLSAAVNPPISISQPQWTIPGTRIGNYVVTFTNPSSPTNATVTSLTSNDLSQSSITFYWVDGGDNREVKYSFTSGGKAYSGKATFNVKRPTAQVTAGTNASTTIDSATGQLELHLGVPPPSSSPPGIAFSRSLTVPMGFSGDAQWVQVFSRFNGTALFTNGQTLSFQRDGLDKVYPYDTAASTSDSPGVILNSSVFTSTSADYIATMWLMFKPTGTSGTAIWVPLRQVTWSWAASANFTNGQWVKTSSSDPANLMDSDSTTHPTWTRIAQP
jgi:hypothetical protein